MQLSECQIKYTATTSQMVKRALGKDAKGEPATSNYRFFTLTDVDLEVLADGLVRLKGTTQLYTFWYGDPMFDGPVPDDWPRVTYERHAWSPLRLLYGPTYEGWEVGSVHRGEAHLDLVVPSSLVTGLPAKETAAA